MSGGVDLSVVIVSYNVAHLLPDCLESLFRECAAIEVEVFVVDNASTDGTVEMVRERFPKVSLRASQENLGFSAGNNMALPECSGRYVLLLNPDTSVHPGSVSTLMGYLDEHPTVGAVGPTLRLEDGRIQPECARNLPSLSNLFPWLLMLDKLEWQLRHHQRHRKDVVHPPRPTLCDRFTLLPWARDKTCEVECICGACMMFRREVVRQIGLLDESSPLFLDDIDYCRRIRKAGWAVHYVQESTVTHLWKQSTSQLKKAGDFYAMGCHAIWLYLRKHEGHGAPMAFSAMACLASPLRVLVSLAGLTLTRGPGRALWRRQLHMAMGLGRWAFRLPKAAPRFGFANEAQRGPLRLASRPASAGGRRPGHEL